MSHWILQNPLLPFLNLSYFNYLISHRGLVKWYNNGLQNLCWVLDYRQADIIIKDSKNHFFGSFTFLIIILSL